MFPNQSLFSQVDLGYVPISPYEGISRTGLVCSLKSGHGIYRDMLRTPKLMKGRIYYRINLFGRRRWVNVDLLLKHIFGTEIRNAPVVYKLIVNLVKMHNRYIRLCVEANERSDVKEAVTWDAEALKELEQFNSSMTDYMD